MFVLRFDAKLSIRSSTSCETTPSLLFWVDTRCTTCCANRVCTDEAMQEKGAGYRRLEGWVLENVNSPSPLPWPSPAQFSCWSQGAQLSPFMRSSVSARGAFPPNWSLSPQIGLRGKSWLWSPRGIARDFDDHSFRFQTWLGSWLTGRGQKKDVYWRLPILIERLQDQI